MDDTLATEVDLPPPKEAIRKLRHNLKLILGCAVGADGVAGQAMAA
jgi:lactate dehydrogenase-like 2-hydroxyacid dehydrogenase